MITPPINTPSFYTAMLENSAAQFVTGLLTANDVNDITHVLITSQNITSDVLAAHELQTGVDKVMLNVLRVGEAPQSEIKFNTIYLPTKVDSDLFDTVQHDDEGDIIKIDGFLNPFISISIKLSTPDERGTIDANVNYKQFKLPTLDTLLSGKRFLTS